LSPKAGRRRSRLAELLETGWAFVLYESPFRILKLLQDLADLDNNRYVCAGREMTKLHEEYLRGKPSEIYALLAQKERQMGEFAVFVSGHKRK
jgi:16S rRNA (cytidine1402-2'-O)-methyltransferase